MKKTISILLSVCLLLSLTFETTALSFYDENSLNSYELYIIKTEGKLLKKTDSEIAKTILAKLGMSQKTIKLLKEEILNEILNSESITKTTQYCRLSEDGIEQHITKKEYEESVAFDKTNLAEHIKSVEQYSYNGSDSYFIKDLYIYKTQNAPNGTYGIISDYDWKNFTGTYRGKDVLSLSGENLIFDKSSFCLAVEFSAAEQFNGVLTSVTETDYMDSTTNPSDIIQSAYAIACKYNLPSNVYGSTYSFTYTDASFVIVCRARIQQYTLPCTFNVYSNYFHQRIFLVGSFSISVSGASVSVSPQLSYWNMQIATTSPISYTP